MKLFRYITISLLLIFTSCKEKNKYENLILGEWIYTKEYSKFGTKNEKMPILISPFDKDVTKGYEFLPNGICEDKLGYFKYLLNENDEKRTLFLGTRTKFKIEDDSLKIFNLYKETWKASKIHSITKNRLTFEYSDGVLVEYAKRNYVLDSKENYDQIILSSSGCYGSCPINDILIDKNGEVLYKGFMYNTVEGYYKSKISTETFRKIELSFKKANIIQLENNYYTNSTDGEEITVTFVKDGKIVKTVSDYMKQSPSEFIWAYISLRYLYQRLNLSKYSELPPYLFDVERLKFEKGDMIYDMTKSEQFYLWSLLAKSIVVNKTFNPSYTIKWNEGIIKTDGRYYSFTKKNKEVVTLDIGFDFIFQNILLKKFRKKLNAVD